MTSPQPGLEAITTSTEIEPETLEDTLDKVCRELLNSSRLLVLAGSGCSVGLRGTQHLAPMMRDLFELTTELDGFDQIVTRYPRLQEHNDVEELLSSVQAVASLQENPDIEDRFLRSATAVIRNACDFIDDSTDLSAHETFLRKIAHRETRQDRVSIFTTNYDLAFETALQRLRYTAIDGFGYGSRSIFSGDNFTLDLVRRDLRGELELAAGVVRLLKLHGSVDWDDSLSYIRRVPIPDNPVLIYPSSNKYRQSFRQPYLEAMSRFQAALREPDLSIIVVGFGFSDDHIVQPIVDALLSQATLRIVVVSPDVTTSDNAVLARLREAVSNGDRRITLIATTFRDFADRIPVTSGSDQWHETQNALARIWSQA